MTTYLLSYPGPTWHIRGGLNFRSKGRPETDPRRARSEWLSLADAIVDAGAEVAVLPPPRIDPPLTGLIYTAQAGQILPGGRRFLLSRMSAPHRQGEDAPVSDFFTRAGLEIEQPKSAWEGQAEICALTGGRYLLTWGVRSAKESPEEVAARLPPESRALAVRIRDPFFHGDTCLSFLKNRAGEGLLLAHIGALVDCGLRDLERFGEKDFEIYPLHEEDALAYACNALEIGGRLLAPRGLSAGLKEALKRRGFELVELDFAELFGKGGGGPRCLVNDLGDLPAPGFARYRDLRDEIALG